MRNAACPVPRPNTSETEQYFPPKQLTRSAWVPIPILLLLVVVLSLSPKETVLGGLELLPVFNMTFLVLVSLLVAILAAASYLTDGSPAILFLGTGVFAYGMTSLLASLSVPGGGYNTGATVYYLGVPLAGFFSLLSALKLPALTGRRRSRLSLVVLVAIYAAVMLAEISFYYFAKKRLLPTFFVEGVGPTALRQLLLGTAFIQFAGASLLIFIVGRRNRSAFFHWYALGLALISVGLLGAVGYKDYGSLSAWVGRGCHYLGGIYLLVALLAAVRKSGGGWKIPLTTLQETYDRYTLLVKTSPDAILVLVEGRIVFANPAAGNPFGVSPPEQLLGRHLLDLVHPDCRSSVEDFLERSSYGKPSPALEAKVLRPGGPPVDVELLVAPVTDEGQPAVQAVLREITERKRAEKELEAAHANLHATLERITDGFHSFDREWRFTYISETGANLIGRKREDVIGRVVWDIFPDAVGRKFHSEYTRAVETGTPTHFEEFYPEPLNTWFECHAYPSSDGLSVFYRDISERKQNEEILGRFKLLAENSRDIVLFLEYDSGRILEANAAAVKAYGYRREELLTLRITDLRPASESWLVSEQMATASDMGILFEAVHVRRDGSTFPVEVSSRGETVGTTRTLISIIRDITERKRAEEELRKSRDELEDRVVQRTRELEEKSTHLEELNAALRVLLRQREEDRKELEESMLANVKNLVLPCVERLKRSTLSTDQKSWLEVLESHLDEITSSFTRTLARQYVSFTPTEIRVADLIKDGKSTKEIAELLCISEKTVASHRDNIRNKLGLRGGRDNLRSYLLTLS